MGKELESLILKQTKEILQKYPVRYNTVIPRTDLPALPMFSCRLPEILVGSRYAEDVTTGILAVLRDESDFVCYPDCAARLRESLDELCRQHHYPEMPFPGLSKSWKTIPDNRQLCIVANIFNGHLETAQFRNDMQYEPPGFVDIGTYWMMKEQSDASYYTPGLIPMPFIRYWMPVPVFTAQLKQCINEYENILQSHEFTQDDIPLEDLDCLQAAETSTDNKNNKKEEGDTYGMLERNMHADKASDPAR